MVLVEKIGRFTIAKNRGALYLRWWNPHQKKTRSERLDADTLELARKIAKVRIREIADRTETVSPESGGDPTFGEVWLGFEQDKRKRLALQRFRLLENRKEIYYKPHLWSVRMSKMGPALRALVLGMEEGQIRPENAKSRLKTLTKDGKPRLHPNTIADIIGTAAEVCVLAKSDGASIHIPPKIPFISGITAPEDRDPKGRYVNFKEIGALIESCRRPHMRDLLIMVIGCGGRIGAVADLTGAQVRLDLGVIDLLGDGSIDNSKRRPIVPVTGPMSRILTRLKEEHGGDYLLWEKRKAIAAGARNWTQMIQRLVARAGIDNGLAETDTRANWYSIRRTFADWLDERVSDAAISAVMGHFEISSRTRHQLFDQGSPTTDIYKRRKLGPVLEVAEVLEREWWPSIQPFTSVDLRSDSDRLMRTDAGS